LQKFFLLIVFCWYSATACHTVEQAQQMALVNNSFLLLYFSDVSSESKHVKEYFWLDSEDAALLDNFVEFTVYTGSNRKYLKKYGITSLPMLLIVDGNGKEIYRYNDYSKPTGIKDALQQLVLPKYFLVNDLNNFHERKDFNSAIRIAQLYLDYSLKVDVRFREGIYRASQSYIAEAEKRLKNKPECLQRLEIVKLFRLAYQKDFPGL
jgi:hypothetical protein